MRTYCLENDIGDVLNYYTRQDVAKRYLIKENNPYACIVCIQGTYFAEGMHKYYMYYRNGKFKRLKRRLP